MIDDRDWHEPPRLDGFGSATTLSEYVKPPRRRKKRPIGFALPKPKKA